MQAASQKAFHDLRFEVAEAFAGFYPEEQKNALQKLKGRFESDDPLLAHLPRCIVHFLEGDHLQSKLHPENEAAAKQFCRDYWRFYRQEHTSTFREETKDLIPLWEEHLSLIAQSLGGQWYFRDSSSETLEHAAVKLAFFKWFFRAETIDNAVFNQKLAHARTILRFIEHPSSEITLLRWAQDGWRAQFGPDLPLPPRPERKNA